MITFIALDNNNAMLRPIAIGKHDGRWFGRTDLWRFGFRFTGWAFWAYLVAWGTALYSLLR